MWRGYDILQVNPSAVKVKFRFISVHCAYLYVYLSALRLGKVHFMALLGGEALTIYTTLTLLNGEPDYIITSVPLSHPESTLLSHALWTCSPIVNK